MKMRLVPSEATEEMRDAAQEAVHYEISENGATRAVNAAIAAAPHAGKVSAEMLEDAALAYEMAAWRTLDPKYHTGKTLWTAYDASEDSGVFFETEREADDYCHRMNARAVLEAIGLEVEG